MLLVQLRSRANIQSSAACLPVDAPHTKVFYYTAAVAAQLPDDDCDDAAVDGCLLFRWWRVEMLLMRWGCSESEVE